MENMREFMEHSIELEKKILKLIDDEVNRIIEENVTDVSIIEYLLDTIMGIILVDNSEVFNKLNNYYEMINKDNALEYRLIYGDNEEK